MLQICAPQGSLRPRCGEHVPGGEEQGGRRVAEWHSRPRSGARRWQVCLLWVGALPHTAEAPQGGLSLGPRWLEEGLTHHPGIAVLWLEVTSVLPPPFPWSSGLGAWGLGGMGTWGMGTWGVGTWGLGTPLAFLSPNPRGVFLRKILELVRVCFKQGMIYVR